MLIITVSLLIVVHYHQQWLCRCTGNIRTLAYARDTRTRRLGVMRYGRVSIARKIETC